MKQVSRRDFLRLVGLGAAGLAAEGLLASCSPGSRRASGGVLPNVVKTIVPSLEPDLEIGLKAAPGEVELFEGRPTQVWAYQGRVLSGDAGAVQSLPGSYLGPVIRVRQGQRVRVNFENGVDEPTIVHWHGLLVPPEMDGHPKDVVQPGGRYEYDFPVRNRAGTYWFHLHPHQLTGPQVYRGLAGLFIVSDDEEDALGLPSGDFDVPLVIQDRSYDNNNQLVYLPNGMMDRMLGFLGDRILVNGRPDFRLSVARQAYRLRLLNGSNSRVYKLAWDDGSPLTVIGTDGGLLAQPVERPYVTLGPAERVELYVDFSHWPLGSELRLKSLPFAAANMMGGPGMGGPEMGGMMGPGGQSSLAGGSEFVVCSVLIEKEGNQPAQLPQTLALLERLAENDSVNARSPRRFSLGMGGMMGGPGMGGPGMGGPGMGGPGMGGPGMGWTINGRTFEMEAVARDEIVRLNTQEAWVFDNAGSGGMGMMGGPGMGGPGMGGPGMGGMMQLSHPMHVHGVQFQVIDRSVQPGFQDAWASLADGFVDEGWKDTVLVLPGEQVKVLMRFQDYAGLYLNHCHNLEHEDLGMMRNYRVG